MKKTERDNAIRAEVSAALAQSQKTGALIAPGAFDRGVVFGAAFVANRLIPRKARGREDATDGSAR